MSRAQAAYWALFAATMAVYLVMVLWSLPAISAAAADLVPFDMRPGGYGEAEARQFLQALTAEGRSFYLNVQLRLDLAFPALAALTLGLALSWLYRASAPLLRKILVFLPFIGSAFDYLENYRIAGLLNTDVADLSAAQISAASFATVLKSGFTTIAMIAILAGLVIWWQRRRSGS